MKPLNLDIVAKSAITPRFDTVRAKRQIGLILLATDLTAESEFARICPVDKVAIFANRIAFENPTTPENLARMLPELKGGAALLLPDEPLDAICFSCTSASVVLGDRAISEAIQSAKPGVPVINPAAAARLGFRALGVSKISVLTPYLPETATPMASYFADHGLDVKNLAYFGLEDDREMARIKPSTIVEAARDTITDDAEALFISCTALRAVEVAEEIERAIGRPVVTSNQANIWLTLRRAGIDMPLTGHGRLLELPIPK